MKSASLKIPKPPVHCAFRAGSASGRTGPDGLILSLKRALSGLHCHSDASKFRPLPPFHQTLSRRTQAVRLAERLSEGFSFVPEGSLHTSSVLYAGAKLILAPLEAPPAAGLSLLPQQSGIPAEGRVAKHPRKKRRGKEPQRGIQTSSFRLR